ncbi:hypothetical protein MHB42_20635 [Lysinibacillus sp. FSL K6-0232]|uniref:hypothetical protein n=1 Tax=Lysinibacillus sp. FSL K6-0232 TaxID=2921425 RepID=UPI0030F87D50
MKYTIFRTCIIIDDDATVQVAVAECDNQERMQQLLDMLVDYNTDVMYMYHAIDEDEHSYVATQYQK